MTATPWRPSAPTLEASWLRSLATGLMPAEHADDADWRAWLRALFPTYVRADFAPYHEAYWDWLWAIAAGRPVRPFVGIWPRGFAKSTAAELGIARVAAARTRGYALYVSETQDQADTHVQNVGALLESPAFAARYPAVASRKLGKYGHSLGWRRNRLRTASGFTVDAVGLDMAVRGLKIEGERPDLIVVDDVDGRLDTPAATAKKVTTLTSTVLATGTATTAVLVIQNL